MEVNWGIDFFSFNDLFLTNTDSMLSVLCVILVWILFFSIFPPRECQIWFNANYFLSFNAFWASSGTMGHHLATLKELDGNGDVWTNLFPFFTSYCNNQVPLIPMNDASWLFHLKSLVQCFIEIAASSVGGSNLNVNLLWGFWLQESGGKWSKKGGSCPWYILQGPFPTIN